MNEGIIQVRFYRGTIEVFALGESVHEPGVTHRVDMALTQERAVKLARELRQALADQRRAADAMEAAVG